MTAPGVESLRDHSHERSVHSSRLPPGPDLAIGGIRETNLKATDSGLHVCTGLCLLSNKMKINKTKTKVPKNTK